MLAIPRVAETRVWDRGRRRCLEALLRCSVPAHEGARAMAACWLIEHSLLPCGGASLTAPSSVYLSVTTLSLEELDRLDALIRSLRAAPVDVLERETH